MTKSERQQSRESARRGAHFLKLYIESQIVDDRIRAQLASLVAEFERLDANSQRPRAGRPRIENAAPATLAKRRWRDKQR